MKLVQIAIAASQVSAATSTLIPLRRRAQSNPVPLSAGLSASFGYLFDAEVSFGNQTLQLLADTGSSDTWALTVGAQCFGADLNGSDPLPLSDCNYPNITYDPTASSSFSQIANETLGAHYGGGIALGIVGIEDVTVAGITVPGQTVGVVDKTSLGGDGIVNGILGLGYPALTSAHPGDSVANDTISLLTNKAVYDPILINMYKQGLLAEPWFSFALERVAAGTDKVGEGSGGFLGLGVLPPSSDIDVISDYVVAPVEITEALPLELTNGKSEITEWTLSVDSVVWSAANQSGVSSNTTKFQAVVDTGNYFNQLPQEISDAIHAAYNPPATLDEDTGAYVVSCDTDTTPASVGITIAGATFYLRPEDLVLEIADGVCVSTVLPSASDGTISLNFLGDIFLQNVVAVFDFGKNEMRFAARADGGGVAFANSSTTTPTPTSTSSSHPTGTTSGASRGLYSSRRMILGGTLLTTMLSLLITFM